MTSRKLFCLHLIFMCCLTLTGCDYSPGSDRSYGSIKLLVTSSGKPLSAGFIQLTNTAEGKSSGATLDEQGIAEIEQVETGRYQILVLPPSPEPGQPLAVSDKQISIPEKYQSLEMTPLQLTVQSGYQELVYDLN